MTGLQMAREMREQPSVLAALSSRRSEIAERVRAVRRDAEPPIPAGLAEPLAAIVAVVRAQPVAVALARHRGLDPDAPRGLSKVTPTI